MKKIALLFVFMSMLIVGCGSETSGTLSVSSPSATNGIVTTTATFTPSSGSALPNQPIVFRWYTVGVNSKDQTLEQTTEGRTDNTGAVTSQFKPPVIRSESLIVYVIASTGGLTNKEGWQSVQVDP